MKRMDIDQYHRDAFARNPRWASEEEYPEHLWRAANPGAELRDNLFRDCRKIMTWTTCTIFVLGIISRLI